MQPINNDDKRQLRRAAFLKLSAMFTFTAAVIVFLTIAWFASNRSVSGEGMSVTAEGFPFDVAAKGSRVRYSSQIAAAKSDFEQGVTAAHNDPSGNSGTYYEGTDKLILRCDTADSEIEPGSSGVITFYIIPKQNGDISADVSLSIVCYADNNGTLTEIDSSDSGDNPAETQKAAEFLSGHIMFFKQLSGNANYTYTGALTDRTLHVSLTNAQQGVAYPVEIRWMWPKTLGQLALKTNSASLRKSSDVPVVEETTNVTNADGSLTDKQLVLDYLNDEKTNVFKFSQSSDYTNLGDKINNADIRDNFNKLTKGYDDADNDIGTYVSYFVVELTITA